MWTENIVDLRYVDHGQDLFLRLAKSELDKDFPLAAVVAPVASTVAVLTVLILIWWRTKTRRNASDAPWSPTLGDLSFDLPTVKMATGNFSQSHVIGEGGFAVVYKGELPDGRPVAVKRLKQAREFWQQDRAMALLDPTVPLSLSTPDSEMSFELERYIRIGLLCVQEAPENRPDMSAVVAMLNTRNSDINLLSRTWPLSYVHEMRKISSPS